MKRISFFLLTWFILGAWSIPVGAEDRALLIGVGHYQDSRADLPGIQKDMEAIKSVALMLGFTEDQIKELRDQEATNEKIKTAIREWLIQGAGPEDRVLFYFSGHGSQLEDKGQDEDDQMDEVLVPHDFKLKDQKLSNTLVDDDFGELLAGIPSQKVFLFIDSCNSGTAAKSVRSASTRGPVRDESAGTSGPASKFLYYPGMPVAPRGDSFSKFCVKERADHFISLSAAQDNEPAIPTQDGSLFTLALLDTVKKFAHENRPMTMKDLEQNTRDYIKDFVDQAQNPRWQVHRPMLFGNKALAEENLFKGKPDAPPSDIQNLWNTLEQLVEKADFPVEVSTNQSEFKVGDKLVLRIKAPKTGYLNIMCVDPEAKEAVVLFPNRFHPANRVEQAEEITIPGDSDRFDLEADAPPRKNMVVVFFTEKEINAYNEGYDAKSLFNFASEKTLNHLKSCRFVPVERKSHEPYGAGKIVVDIK